MSTPPSRPKTRSLTALTSGTQVMKLRPSIVSNGSTLQAQVNELQREREQFVATIQKLQEQVQAQAQELAAFKAGLMKGISEEMEKKVAAVTAPVQALVQSVDQLKNEIATLRAQAPAPTYATTARGHPSTATATATTTTQPQPQAATTATQPHPRHDCMRLRLAPQPGSTVHVPNSVADATQLAHTALKALYWEDRQLQELGVRVQVQHSRANEPVAVVISMSTSDAKLTLRNMRYASAHPETQQIPAGWKLRPHHAREEWIAMQAMYQVHGDTLRAARGRVQWGPGRKSATIRGEPETDLALPTQTPTEGTAAPAQGGPVAAPARPSQGNAPTAHEVGAEAAGQEVTEDTPMEE